MQDIEIQNSSSEEWIWLETKTKYSGTLVIKQFRLRPKKIWVKKKLHWSDVHNSNTRVEPIKMECMQTESTQATSVSISTSWSPPHWKSVWYHVCADSSLRLCWFSTLRLLKTLVKGPKKGSSNTTRKGKKKVVRTTIELKKEKNCQFCELRLSLWSCNPIELCEIDNFFMWNMVSVFEEIACRT